MKTTKTRQLKIQFLVCLTLLVSTSMFSQSVFKDVSNQIPQTAPNGIDSVDSDLLDVDNDGDLDIFIAEGTAGFAGRANRLLLNDGDGNFTDVSTSHLPFSPRPANSLSADFADIDNDGDIDIVVANLGPTQLLINDGTGIFTDESMNLLPPPPVDIIEDISTEISFEDVNQDGKLDIFVTNEIPPIPGVGPGGSQNFLYLQYEDGSFSDESLTQLPNVKNQSSSFVFGDIDADGDRDLIISNVGQNQVLINDGNGFFTDETSARIAQQLSTTRSLVLSDIDCDLDLDLIVSNSNLEQNQVFLNDSNGFFQENTVNALPVKLDTSSDVKIFDFNYDRHPDLIFANAIPNPMGPGAGHPLAPAPNLIYINDGTGIFTDKSSTYLPENSGISFDIEIADINGDRLEDILISNANDGEEQLLIRDITPPTRFRKIIPFTNCVVDNEDGTYTATFGYYNFNRTAVYIPESHRNRLFPFNVDVASDQPVIFFKGKVEEAFTATFDRFAVWKVNRRRAYANKRSFNCNGDYDYDRNDARSSFRVSNYPNPFSTSTSIRYHLPEASKVTIEIYNEFGIKIKTIENLSEEKGIHEQQIHANSIRLKPGIYFYSVSAGKHKATRSFLVKR